MVKIDFSNQKVVICGLQGSGKTFLSKKLVQNKKVLVFSPHKHDWIDTNVFFYSTLKYDYENLEIFLSYAEKLAKKKQIEGVLIDEADMYFRSNYDIKENLNNWVLNHRHIGGFMILITRRPQDIPTKIFESSKYLLVFSLQGQNVISKFNNMWDKWGDEINKLNYESREYFLKEIGKTPIKISSKIKS